ncbi:MAG: hypothetical protein JNJ55_07090 [Betaproteobacteria bacterium]|nr:hypothetical protein [Betaproteobacteria bacterium]
MNQTFLRVLVAAAVLAVLGLGVRACSAPKAIPNPFDKGSRAYEPYAAFAKRIAANPQWVAKLNARARNSPDPKTLGFEIADRGIRRLDNAALEQRMVFALKLVENMDTATCAALARPDAERNRALQPAFLKAIEQLPLKDIEGYLALVERAIGAELDGVPEPAFSMQQAEASVQKLADKFSDGERAVLLRVVNFPSVTTNDTACWMVKTVFSEILALPSRDRQVLARVFSTPAK